MTFELAMHLFDYNPSTGVLTWRKDRSRTAKKGDEAGTLLQDKARRKSAPTAYKVVRYKGKKYLVHHIVWLMAYGVWPKDEIDHEDGDGCNNRIGNLRDVTHVANTRNCRKSTNNRSGVNGVHWHTGAQKWAAGIKVNGKTTHLGTYTTIEEAAAARKAADVRYGFHELHGTEKQ